MKSVVNYASDKNGYTRQIMLGYNQLAAALDL